MAVLWSLSASSVQYEIEADVFPVVYMTTLYTMNDRSIFIAEVRWPSGTAFDSRARGGVFDPPSGRHVVSLSMIYLPPKSTGNTQEVVAPSRHVLKIDYWDG